MNAETIVRLLEEMVDIKVQQQAEMHLKTKPELMRMLEEKRFADLRRLELVRSELIRQLNLPS